MLVAIFAHKHALIQKGLAPVCLLASTMPHSWQQRYQDFHWWCATGGPARTTNPSQLPCTGQTGLTFKQVQFTPVLDGVASFGPSTDSQPGPSPRSNASLLLTGQAHSQPSQAAGPGAGISSAPGSAVQGFLQRAGDPARVAQMEAMLALHMEHSRPCSERAAADNEIGMAEADELEVCVSFAVHP